MNAEDYLKMPQKVNIEAFVRLSDKERDIYENLKQMKTLNNGIKVKFPYPLPIQNLRVIQAGNDYYAVQKRVNEMIQYQINNALSI